VADQVTPVSATPVRVALKFAVPRTSTVVEEGVIRIEGSWAEARPPTLAEPHAEARRIAAAAPAAAAP
jgi:hypothetical protein